MNMLFVETLNTLYMVFASGFFAFLFGMPLGIILAITQEGSLNESRLVNKMLGIVVNIGRSIPFAILMIALIPLMRLLVGTSIGTTASIVPLTIAAIPFVARLVETSLKNVGRELIDAAAVMEASPSQIIWKVLVAEARPQLVQSATLMLVNLVGYSAMAGLVGGGGLGKVAIQYGYLRFNTVLMLETLVILLVLVEAIQWGGSLIVRAILKKRGIV